MLFIVLTVLERASVSLFVVTSMLGAGMIGEGAAVREALQCRRFAAVALLQSFVAAPLLAFGLGRLLGLEREFSDGLILVAGTAGAPFLPRLIELAEADIPAGAALVLLLTLGTIVFLVLTAPGLVPGGELRVLRSLLPLGAMVLVPFFAGVLLIEKWEPLASAVAPVVALTAKVSLLILFTLLLGTNLKAVFAVVGSGALLASVLFFGGLTFGVWCCGGKHRKTLASAALARNFGFALALAESTGAHVNMRVMIVISALVCVCVSFPIARRMSRVPGL